LVSQILSATPKASPQTEPTPTPTPLADPDTEAAALIDVYFELEEPVERDVLFERLVQVPSPLVNEFLLGMLEEDQDETLRLYAARELALRGYTHAIEILEAQFNHPADIEYFLIALDALCKIRPVGFYDKLLHVWHDETRDPDEALEAMHALEDVDPDSALHDYIGFVATFGQNTETLFEDQLEVALESIERHKNMAALEAIEAAQHNLQAQTELDEDEKTMFLNSLRWCAEMLLTNL
jgi:hypothetical protein